MLLLLTCVPSAPWDRPALAVPAFAVTSLLFLGMAAWSIRTARDARRRLAAPPGPARDMPQPGSRETRLRWVLGLGVFLVVAGLVLGLAGGLD